MKVHRTHSFRTLAVAMFAFSILVSATSQDDEKHDKDREDQVKFTARTDLVLIPAVVTDKSGKHITGLKREDFTVQENGAAQQIASFEEIRTDPHPLPSPANNNEFSNFVDGEPSTSRITLIVFDLINTSFAAQAIGREELLKYLTESVDAREPTALYTLTRDGLHVVHDFTTDPAILVAALHEVKGDSYQMVDSPQETGTAASNSQGPPAGSGSSGPSAGSNSKGSSKDAAQSEAASIQSFLKEAQSNFRSFEQRLAINYTLDGMQQVAQALAGYPGRKSLIWASGGFPFSVSGNTMKLAPAGRETLTDVLPLYEHTWQLLNDAEVSIYAVDVKGLQVVAVPDASMRSGGKNPSKNFRRAMARNLDTESTLQTFASMTGGRAYYNSNDLVKGFRDAVNDSSEYYMLGYYLNHSNSKPGWRKLTVRVDRDHTEVRARTGFFVTNATVDPETTRKIDISSALLSSLDYTSLALSARWGKSEPAKDLGQKFVSYELHFSPKVSLINSSDSNHVSLDVVTLAFTPDGKRVGEPRGQKIDIHLTPERAALIEKQGLTFREVLNLAPGEYRVRFVARDDFTGRTGSVAAPLKVE